MRTTGLLWLLGACACSTPNPLFGLMTEDLGAASTGAGSTDEPPPTTSLAGTGTGVGADDTTAGVAEVSSQPDPDTGATATSDPSTSDTGDTHATLDTDTDEPVWICDPEIHGIAQNVPRDLDADEPWTGCNKGQLPYETIAGHGKMVEGALLFVIGSCNNMDEGDEIEFGAGYPAANRSFCGKLHVVWALDPGCKIAAFALEEYDAMDKSLGILYARYHSPADPIGKVPYAPKLADEGSCGCPGGEDGCCPYEPGQHALEVAGIPVEPGMTKALSDSFKFTNWNANVPPECVMDASTPLRIDWFGERL